MPRICTPDKILNPVTGRCVSRNGAIGRRIVCSDNEIRNPATGRCVKRDGALGRRILRQNGGNAPARPANRPPARPANRPVNQMTKSELLVLIDELCSNPDEDPISFDEWKDLTASQLRTIVRLLDNGGVDFFSQRKDALRPGEHPRRFYCFLLRNIKSWMQSHSRPWRHPVTNVPLTPTQVKALSRTV